MREDIYFYVYSYDGLQIGITINWNKKTIRKNKGTTHYGYSCFELKNRLDIEELMRFLKNCGFKEVISNE